MQFVVNIRLYEYLHEQDFNIIMLVMRKVGIYQSHNQKPQIEERRAIQWP
jgi:hypothetical protein